MEFKVSQQDILDAHARIKEYIHRTPILTDQLIRSRVVSFILSVKISRKLVPLRQEED